MRLVLAWSAFWVGFGVLDYAADRHGNSLCTAIRRVFHTDTPAGQVALTAALGAGRAVLERHLLKPPK